MPEPSGADDAFAAALTDPAGTSAGHAASAGTRRPPVPLDGYALPLLAAPGKPKPLTGAHGEQSARPLEDSRGADRLLRWSRRWSSLLWHRPVDLILDRERTIVGHGTATLCRRVRRRVHTRSARRRRPTVEFVTTGGWTNGGTASPSPNAAYSGRTWTAATLWPRELPRDESGRSVLVHSRHPCTGAEAARGDDPTTS